MAGWRIRSEIMQPLFQLKGQWDVRNPVKTVPNENHLGSQITSIPWLASANSTLLNLTACEQCTELTQLAPHTGPTFIDPTIARASQAMHNTGRTFFDVDRPPILYIGDTYPYAGRFGNRGEVLRYPTADKERQR